MTIIHFLDGKLEYSDPKTARGKLRKMGLSVRNAQKKDQDYYFSVNKPDGVSTPRVIVGRESRAKGIAKALGEIKEIPKLETAGEQTVVEGRDLKAYDVLVNFIPMVDLTIDHRGISEIVIPPYDSTRIINRFNGFYSVESNSISSYLIDPSENYLVSRRGGG